MSSRRNGQNFDPDAVKLALQKPSAWEIGDIPGDKLDIDEEELADGREFIRLASLA